MNVYALPSSVEVGMPRSSACDGDELCDEFRPGGGGSFAAVYRGDPPSRTIASLSGLRLVADLSPLVVGHLLLLPEHHHLSFGHLDAGLIGQVREVVGWLRQRYVATFGQMAIMEHGSSTATPSGCITHAHWHILPVNGSQLAEMITLDGLSAIRLPNLTALRRFAEADQPYFYCADGDNHVAFEAHPSHPAPVPAFGCRHTARHRGTRMGLVAGGPQAPAAGNDDRHCRLAGATHHP
ncbi:hypothetical protein [Micromonospora sp. LOL_021]|uniref:hypothetical protein n=1 Tax=Micromonospora sp. LOL_021 TaxID=3345417 RepID=UPI003A88B3CD